MISEFFWDWLKGRHNQDYAFGNAYGLIERNDRIYVCFAYDPEEEWYNYFNATRQEMLEILKEWTLALLAARKLQPKVHDVVIMQEHGKTTIFLIDANAELTEQTIQESIAQYMPVRETFGLLDD